MSVGRGSGALAALAVIALLGSPNCSSADAAESATPSLPRLQAIDGRSVDALKTSFNAVGGPRVIVFFSSACHACNEGSRLLNEMLASVPGDLSVLAVWEPIDKSDGPPPAAWLDNLKDPRVRQLWDPAHVLSSELRRTELAFPTSVSQARLRMDKRPDGILYDTAVVFDGGASWEKTLPAPAYFDGGLAAVLPALRQHLIEGTKKKS